MKEKRRVIVEFTKKDVIHNKNIIEVFVRKIRENGFNNNKQKS